MSQIWASKFPLLVVNGDDEEEADNNYDGYDNKDDDYVVLRQNTWIRCSHVDFSRIN